MTVASYTTVYDALKLINKLVCIYGSLYSWRVECCEVEFIRLRTEGQMIYRFNISLT